MGDFWIDMAFAVLFRTIKNPKSVAKLKAPLRKLRDILNNLPLD